MLVERRLKLVTEQHNIDKPSLVEGFPMKEWSIKLYILDADGNEHPADCFSRVTYNLHPSFENPTQTFQDAPFTCKNEGWGEFDMSIDCYYTEKTKITVAHDLNFQSPTYANIRDITFKQPSRDLQAILRATGPLPTDDDRRARKGGDGGSKNKRKFNVDKLADGLVKLGEDDLLKVIQLIHDNKTEETQIQHNLDLGEFAIDLYTLPDALGVKLEDFVNTRLDNGY